jgi:hypothetical protein
MGRMKPDFARTDNTDETNAPVRDCHESAAR